MGLFMALGIACGSESEPPARPESPVAKVATAPAADTKADVTSSEAEPSPGSAGFTSRTFHVNQKWKSMEGPSHVQAVKLVNPERPELLWLTGYRAEIVGADPDQSVSQEFMCHNNLDADRTLHPDLFGWAPSKFIHFKLRLFTVSQGQFGISFPEGFGIPVRSDEALNLTTQVLNHNVEDANLQIKHQVDIDYLRDEETDIQMTPLYPSAVFIMASLEDTDAYFDTMSEDITHEGTSCAVGSVPEGVKSTAGIYEDDLGRKFTGHWVVKPGREVRHTVITNQLGLTFDTRAHFVAAHLHPFAESLELRDLTTGESLYTARARGPETGIGLAHVDSYSSKEGFPLYKDHEYELISVYDNTSGVDQDAMATFFLYLHDADAEKTVKYMRKLREWADDST